MLTVEVSGVFPRSVSRPFIRRMARLAYGFGGGKGSSSVSIAAVGDREMRKLNKRYRGKDKVTDILSFGFQEKGRERFPSPFTLHPSRSLGDLVICIPQVKRQAKEIDRTVRDEMALMVVHGILHLLGYDHESLADERRMFGLQHDILIKAGIL